MLRTISQLKLPDISKITDPATKAALEQLLRFLYDNQTRVHDDLTDANNGVPGPQGPAGPAGADGKDGADGIFSEIASEAEAEAGTDNTKGMTPLRTAEAIALLAGTGLIQYADTRFHVGSITRDMTSNTSSSSHTGVGFKPSCIIFLAYHSIVNTAGSIGYAANASIISYGIQFCAGTIYGVLRAISIYTSVGPNIGQQASVNSFNSDGFTLTWAKDGSPTGIATIYYLAMK